MFKDILDEKELMDLLLRNMNVIFDRVKDEILAGKKLKLTIEVVDKEKTE